MRVLCDAFGLSLSSFCTAAPPRLRGCSLGNIKTTQSSTATLCLPRVARLCLHLEAPSSPALLNPWVPQVQRPEAAPLALERAGAQPCQRIVFDPTSSTRLAALYDRSIKFW